MARYTFRVCDLFSYYPRETVESWFSDYQLSDFLNQKQIDVINSNQTWSKEKLAKKIVDHYYMREIGFETPALFRHFAIITMKEIMESKLPLIYSNCLDYDPLVNVDYTETFNRKIEGTTNSQGSSNSSSSANSNNNGSSLNINSDTPQGQINKNEILNGNYATSTNASENSSNNSSNVNDETSSTSSGSSNNKEEFTRHLQGNQGITASYQALINQYRNNIVSIDKDIIEELNILFMGIF